MKYHNLYYVQYTMCIETKHAPLKSHCTSIPFLRSAIKFPFLDLVVFGKLMHITYYDIPQFSQYVQCV